MSAALKKSVKHHVSPCYSVGTNALRHIFATAYFEKWKNGDGAFQKYTTIDRFLEFLAARLNTSPKMLVDWYVEFGVMPVQTRRDHIVLFP